MRPRFLPSPRSSVSQSEVGPTSKEEDQLYKLSSQSSESEIKIVFEPEDTSPRYKKEELGGVSTTQPYPIDTEDQDDEDDFEVLEQLKLFSSGGIP